MILQIFLVRGLPSELGYWYAILKLMGGQLVVLGVMPVSLDRFTAGFIHPIMVKLVERGWKNYLLKALEEPNG